MDLKRLHTLLDAYGADPGRWPAAERVPALALVERSPEARRARDAAAALDRVLDLAPDVEPSLDLGARVLANVPRRPSRLPRTLAFAVPLAAAATLVVWVVRMPPSHPEPLTPDAIAALSTFTTPTDVLLDPTGLDLADALPSYGCTEGELGCIDVGPADERDSRLEKGSLA